MADFSDIARQRTGRKGATTWSLTGGGKTKVEKWRIKKGKESFWSAVKHSPKGPSLYGKEHVSNAKRRLGAGMKKESWVTTVYSKMGGMWNRMGV